MSTEVPLRPLEPGDIGVQEDDGWFAAHARWHEGYGQHGIKELAEADAAEIREALKVMVRVKAAIAEREAFMKTFGITNSGTSRAVIDALRAILPCDKN